MGQDQEDYAAWEAAEQVVEELVDRLAVLPKDQMEDVLTYLRHRMEDRGLMARPAPRRSPEDYAAA